ncbi:glutathione S-transferase [Xylariomycetidae sp. FL0641]|nr:glutathione S-transferase [Xylariomycetidae sp. FL0641]
MAHTNLYVPETPDGVKHARGLHLLTADSGNGQAVQILLEELADAYGLTWTTTLIDMKSQGTSGLNPNGRVPVLVDNRRTPPLAVHESSAELLYLLESEDRNQIFGFDDDPVARSELLQWLFFWHGSGAPYQGQVIHFTRAAPGNMEYATNRFRNETLRVFGVLETRLSGKYNNGEPRDYLAGAGRGKYSVADIKTWPWVNYWQPCGFTQAEMDAFPHLLEWIDRIAQRPAVRRGIGAAYKPA